MANGVVALPLPFPPADPPTYADDPASWERLHFTATEISEMQALSIERLRNARAKGRRHQVVPDDPDLANIQGFMGEWAVADSLGRPRPKNVTGDSDGGVDVHGSIAVRLNPRPRGRLMSPVSQRRTSRWMVLVYQVGRQEVAIAGGVLTSFFEQHCHRQTFRVDTYFLECRELVAWPSLKQRL